MARLIVVTQGVPHDSRGASRVLFFRYIERLRRDGHTILGIALLESDDRSADDVPEFRDKLGIEVFVCRADRFVEQGRWRHRLRSDAIAPAIERCHAFAPDALVCFDLVAAWAMRAVPGIPRLVWLGDLRFETVWWHAVYAAAEDWRNARHIPGNYLGCRAWRLTYREALSGDATDIVVASHSSVAQLAALGIKATYEPYPSPEPASVAPRQPAERPTFVFFGSLVGLGSRSGLHFLLEGVFPLLRRRWGANGFRLLLAGSGALPDWAEAALAGKSEITTLGFVDNL